jgi:hypothetical protein
MRLPIQDSDAAPSELVEAGREYVAAREAYEAELAARWTASKATQAALLSGVSSMFDAASTAMLAACTAVQEMESENARLEATR